MRYDISSKADPAEEGNQVSPSSTFYVCNLLLKQSKLVLFETLHGSSRAVDGTAYFAKAISYSRKMFMKLTKGVNVIKLFSSS
jgi:hypothetical protein